MIQIPPALSKQIEMLDNAKNNLLIKRAEQTATKAELVQLQTSLAQAEKKGVLLDKTSAALERLTELKKKETTGKIEAIISYGLQTIFEDSSYKFLILSSVVRKQVVYSFRVVNDESPDEKGMDILESRGGGVVSIVSFLLRVVLLCMTDTKAERFIALDEPFSALSEDYHENLVTAIKQITSKLNVQLLIVSHQKSLDAFGDIVYEVTQRDGKATIKETRNDYARIKN